MAKSTTAKQAQDDVSELRHQLYQVVEKNAGKLAGWQVVRALKDISEDMFSAGVDGSLRETQAVMHDLENIASAWDLTWLTLFAVKLSKLKPK